jgi:hypothetical protein
MTIFHQHLEPTAAASLRRPQLRSVARLLRVGLRVVYRAIVAAKTRRLERELLLQDLAKGSQRFPQAPLILGDKWDF